MDTTCTLNCVSRFASVAVSFALSMHPVSNSASAGPSGFMHYEVPIDPALVRVCMGTWSPYSPERWTIGIDHRKHTVSGVMRPSAGLVCFEIARIQGPPYETIASANDSWNPNKLGSRLAIFDWSSVFTINKVSGDSSFKRSIEPCLLTVGTASVCLEMNRIQGPTWGWLWPRQMDSWNPNRLSSDHPPIQPTWYLPVRVLIGALNHVGCLSACRSLSPRSPELMPDRGWLLPCQWSMKSKPAGGSYSDKRTMICEWYPEVDARMGEMCISTSHRAALAGGMSSLPPLNTQNSVPLASSAAAVSEMEVDDIFQQLGVPRGELP